MKTRFVVLMALFCLASPLAFSQPYGIFDNAADWGGPDSPPQLGNYKVAGSVEVTGSGADATYLMRGNGDDIWGNSDEGYFIYSNLSGSWSLSAKVYWEDPGSNEWSKVGVMMRETGDAADSRHYWTELRGAGYGDRVDAQWRLTTGGSSGNVQIFEEDGTTPVADIADGIYLRIRRYAEINLIESQYSYDGTEWFPSDSQTIEFPEEIAWGLVITNHVDDEYLVEATVSEVVLEQIENVVGVTRKLDSDRFLPGQTINVTLDLFNPSADPIDSLLTETPPAGLAVSNISDNGAESGGNIEWNISVPSGNSSVSYAVTVPADYDPSVSGYSAVWTGTDGTITFVGADTLYLIDVTVGDELFSFDFEDAAQVDQWEDLAGFWDIEEGIFYEFMDAGGPLVTLTGEPLTDCAISVRAMGSVDDADWGITFRATDISNFYSWQFVNGYLMLILYSGGTRSELYSEAFSQTLDEWQDYLVIVKGNAIYLYFNGELHAIVEDDTHAEGQVGLFGWINAGSDLSQVVGGIAFDDLIVSSVGEPVDVASWSLY